MTLLTWKAGVFRVGHQVALAPLKFDFVWWSVPLGVSTDRTSGRHTSVHLLKYFSEVQQWKEGHMVKKLCQIKYMDQFIVVNPLELR